MPLVCSVSSVGVPILVPRPAVGWHTSSGEALAGTPRTPRGLYITSHQYSNGRDSQQVGKQHEACCWSNTESACETTLSIYANRATATKTLEIRCDCSALALLRKILYGQSRTRTWPLQCDVSVPGGKGFAVLYARPQSAWKPSGKQVIHELITAAMSSRDIIALTAMVQHHMDVRHACICASLRTVCSNAKKQYCSAMIALTVSLTQPCCHGCLVLVQEDCQQVIHHICLQWACQRCIPYCISAHSDKATRATGEYSKH